MTCSVHTDRRRAPDGDGRCPFTRRANVLRPSIGAVHNRWYASHQWGIRDLFWKIKKCLLFRKVIRNRICVGPYQFIHYVMCMYIYARTTFYQLYGKNQRKTTFDTSQRHLTNKYCSTLFVLDLNGIRFVLFYLFSLSPYKCSCTLRDTRNVRIYCEIILIYNTFFFRVLYSLFGLCAVHVIYRW